VHDDRLALAEAHRDLEASHQRFNALAQVAGREMPRYLKRPIAVPLTIAVSAGAAAMEARFGAKGAIGNAVLAGVAYGIGMLAGDNADLREGAYMFATALGSAAASVATYDKVTSMIAQTTAPVPPPAAAA